MEDIREKKGKEGEDYVNNILKDVLSNMDYENKILQNSYLPFESIYGNDGYISAELDFIIFTPYFIYIVEVKNESYSKCDYSDSLWVLKDGTKVSNPIEQNHTHKLVFCSEMKIALHKVITIEVLLEDIDDIKEKTSYRNDFVFGKKGLKENLLYLLSTENRETLDYQAICESFTQKVSQRKNTNKNPKDEHISLLKRTEIIETRMRNVINYIPFRRTDIVKCDCCETGKLVFREMRYKNENAKRKSKHYALGCTNYKKNSIFCNRGLVFVDKDKERDSFKKIKPIHIEERNEWGDEPVNQTVLDKINKMEEQNKELNKKNIRYIKEINKLRSLLINSLKEKENIERQYDEQNDLVNRLKEDNNKKDKEISCFKKIIGKIYVRTK